MKAINNVSSQLQGDRWIWVIYILLSIFSVIAVYSTTSSIAFKVRDGNTNFYLYKQILLVGGGAVLAVICYIMHYKKFSKIAPLFLFISIVLLILTYFFGIEINHAKRWIRIFGLTFQPSEIAKLALIIYMARQIASKQDSIKDFWKGVLPLILPVVIVCTLIAPYNLSTALVLFFTCIVMMYIGRVNKRSIFAIFASGVVIFTMILTFSYITGIGRATTWISRLKTFWTGTGGYQLEQAKIAIANGGIFGLGPGNSLQRHYLPSPYADYVYAMIMEEFGLFGGLVIMSLYIILLFRCIKLVNQSPKAFGAILAFGIGLMLVIQAFANMAVSVDLVPVTGLALPMISMGGTSVLFTCIAFGIILSVSKYIEQQRLKDIVEEV